MNGSDGGAEGPRRAPSLWPVDALPAERRNTGALIAVVACVLMAAVTLIITVSSLDNQIRVGWGSKYSRPLIAVLYLSFAIVGYVVTTRRPGNKVGPILIAAGLLAELQGLTDAYSFFLPEGDPSSYPPGVAVMRWFSEWLWFVWMGLIGIYLVLVFPDGRLLSRRWRIVAYIAVAAIAVGVAAEALIPFGLSGTPRLDNPFGIEGAEGFLEGLSSVAAFPWLLCIAAAALSMWVRYRAASSVKRLQLKWFLYACLFVLVPPSVIAGALASGRGSAEHPGWLLAIEDFQILAWAAIPLAAGIAVLRHRLYNIDVIINRTLVYTTVSATLVFTYALVVAIAQTLLSGITGESSFAIAASTLVVAALFRPARAAVQTFVDRRFYRSKYDAERVVRSADLLRAAP